VGYLQRSVQNIYSDKRPLAVGSNQSNTIHVQARANAKVPLKGLVMIKSNSQKTADDAITRVFKQDLHVS
jgi:hypothetical protein